MYVHFKNRAFTSNTPTIEAVQWNVMGDHANVIEAHIDDHDLLTEGSNPEASGKSVYALKVGLPPFERLVRKVHPTDWIVGKDQSLEVVSDFELHFYYDEWLPVEEELARAVGEHLGMKQGVFPPLTTNGQGQLVNAVWQGAIKLLRNAREHPPIHPSAMTLPKRLSLIGVDNGKE